MPLCAADSSDSSTDGHSSETWRALALALMLKASMARANRATQTERLKIQTPKVS